MSKPRFSLHLQPGVGSGQGFTPFRHWRPDAPTGTPIPEKGGCAPPPPPLNSSSGGRHEPSYVPSEVRAREATAANIAAHEAALAPRRWTPPGERS